MNPRATIALLVVTLLVVGGLAYLRQTVTPTRDAAEIQRYAIAFNPAELEGFDLTRGNETLRFRRDTAGWRLVEPVQDRADPAAVDRLLATARFLDVRDRQRSRNAAAESGLANPRVRLDLRGTRDLRLDFGSATALPGEVFARVGGEPHVLRVPDSILELATAPIESFRDPRLTDLVPGDIERITIRRDDGEMSLRLERGRWFIERPVRAPADARAVRDFLERMLGLRITGFNPPDATTAPDVLPGQVARLAMTPRGGGEEILLEIVQEDAADRFTARFPPRGGLLAVDAAGLLLFHLSPEDLRDRSLGYVEPDAVDRIVLSTDKGTSTLLRREHDWLLSETGRPLDADQVAAAVEAFNETRIATFGTAASPQETGLDEPGLAIRFYAWLSENTPEEAAGGHLVAAVEFGHDAANDTAYARTSAEGETVTVPSDLPSRWLDLIFPDHPEEP